MKTKYFMQLVIVAALMLTGCSTKSYPDYNATLVPQSFTSSPALTDMNKSADVIKRRLLNFFDIPVDNIKTEVTENHISITIKNIDTIKLSKIKEVITGYSRLEFWETYENSEILGRLKSINDRLKEMKDSSGVSDLKSQKLLLSKLKPLVTEKGEPMAGCMVGLANINDTSAVNELLKMGQVRTILPGDIRFFWSAKPYRYDKSNSTYGLHAIRVTTVNGQAPLDGSVFFSAKPVQASGSRSIMIDLSMDTTGTRKWAAITRRNINRCIAVVYNGSVISYPRVMSEISGGNTEISGDFSTEEANDLVNILKSGELPFKIKIAREQVTERK
jgi:SecD/SecF fusion protein